MKELTCKFCLAVIPDRATYASTKVGAMHIRCWEVSGYGPLEEATNEKLTASSYDHGRSASQKDKGR